MPGIIPDDQGLIAETPIPNPAAGFPLSYTPPTRNRHRILSLSFYLTTDANVANRTVWFGIDFSGAMHQIAVSAQPQTAGATFLYNFTTCPIASTTAVAFLLASRIVCTPIGDSCFLSPRTDLNVNVINIQAGDQLSAIMLSSQLWPSN